MLHFPAPRIAAIFAVVIALSNHVSGSGLNRDQIVPSKSDGWHTSDSKVISQAVTFSNAGATLAGTVYLPRTGNHLPGIVLLHDAAAGTRELPLYKRMTDGLPSLGFAVLSFDRRGSGQSSGTLKGTDYETLADDAIAGLNALSQMPRVDPGRIGFWGLSQGGWLAVLAAGRTRKAAFAISVSAPLVSANEQMLFATTNSLLIHGYSREDVQEMLEVRRTWIGYLRGTVSQETAVAALSKAEQKPWFGLTYLPKPPQISRDPALLRKMDDDPLLAIGKAHVPLLFLFGDSDPWIPVEVSMQRLAELKKLRPDIHGKVISSANHEMMFPAEEMMEVNPNNNAPQSPTYFMVLASWLTHLFCEQKNGRATEIH